MIKKNKYSYISYNILRKYYNHKILKDNINKNQIKIWSKSSIILPIMVNSFIHVYNGKDFLPLHILNSMVGYKIGEFIFTRTFKSRKEIRKKITAKKI